MLTVDRSHSNPSPHGPVTSRHHRSVPPAAVSRCTEVPMRIRRIGAVLALLWAVLLLDAFILRPPREHHQYPYRPFIRLSSGMVTAGLTWPSANTICEFGV